MASVEWIPRRCDRTCIVAGGCCSARNSVPHCARPGRPGIITVPWPHETTGWSMAPNFCPWGRIGSGQPPLAARPTGVPSCPVVHSPPAAVLFARFGRHFTVARPPAAIGFGRSGDAECHTTLQACLSRYASRTRMTSTMKAINMTPPASHVVRVRSFWIRFSNSIGTSPCALRNRPKSTVSTPSSNRLAPAPPHGTRPATTQSIKPKRPAAAGQCDPDQVPRRAVRRRLVADWQLSTGLSTVGQGGPAVESF